MRFSRANTHIADPVVVALLQLTDELDVQHSSGRAASVEVNVDDQVPLRAVKALEAAGIVALNHSQSKAGRLVFSNTRHGLPRILGSSHLKEKEKLRRFAFVIGLIPTVDAEVLVGQWTQTSDPGQASQDFRYIVHAASPQFRELTDLDFFRHPSQEVNVVLDPTRLAEAAYINASLIDQQHSHTFGPVGLILDVPSPNVLFAAGRDSNRYHDLLRGMHSRGEKSALSPEELLQQTEGYNELGLVVDGEYASIKATGYFSRVHDQGGYIHPRLSEGIEVLAEKFAMPHVLIPADSKSPWTERMCPTPRALDGKQLACALRSKREGSALRFVAARQGDEAISILGDGTAWRVPWTELNSLLDVHVVLGEQMARRAWRTAEPVDSRAALSLVGSALKANNESLLIGSAVNMYEPSDGREVIRTFLSTLQNGLRPGAVRGGTLPGSDISL